MGQVQHNSSELAKEFTEATEYLGWGPSWQDMPIMRSIAGSMAAGTFYDMEVDRVGEAHKILINLQKAGYCIVQAAQLADLEARANQVSKTE